ncbi:uncharacterized protein LOC124459935 [Drosophila willistoni]|uniref:uncharacterized protein LOC124459935 n=1 Tax=Drosophila willistoni TaxID=7260 RepID=UPI00017D6F7F|nr:uncharacterized protein LOC124459935 [Drosophila willistoni]
MLLCPYDDCNYHTERTFNLKRHTERHRTKKKPIKGYKCSQCSYESDRYHNALKHLQAIHRGKGSLVKFDKTETQLQPEQEDKNKKSIEGFKCSLCPYESVRYHNGMKHLQAIHGGEGSIVKFDKTGSERFVVKFGTTEAQLQPKRKEKKKPIVGYKCSQCWYESDRYNNAMKHLQAIHHGKGSLVKFDKTEAPLQPEQNEKLELNNGLEANSRLERREEFHPNSELHREAEWEEQIEFKQEPAWENTSEFEESLNLSTGLEEEFDCEQREECESHREPEWEDTEFKQEPPWEEEPEWEQESKFIHEPEWEDATEFEEKIDVKQEPDVEYVDYEIVFQDEIEVKQEL